MIISLAWTKCIVFVFIKSRFDVWYHNHLINKTNALTYTIRNRSHESQSIVIPRHWCEIIVFAKFVWDIFLIYFSGLVYYLSLMIITAIWQDAGAIRVSLEAVFTILFFSSIGQQVIGISKADRSTENGLCTIELVSLVSFVDHNTVRFDCVSKWLVDYRYAELPVFDVVCIFVTNDINDKFQRGRWLSEVIN